MFNDLINAAKKLINNILGKKPATPAPKAKPIQVKKPVTFAPLQKTLQIASTWVNPNSSAAEQARARSSIAQTQANNRKIAAENAKKAAAEAKRKADAQKAVWGAINNAKKMLSGVFGAKSKQTSTSQNKIIIMPEIKRFKPMAPLQPVPVMPTPVWKDKSGVWHGNPSDIKAYEKDIDRYNTQWKKYVDDRFKYSDQLFTYNQQKAEDAAKKSQDKEAMKLWRAKVDDKKANIWGQIGNFFTGGKTQQYRDNIKNTIEADNKKLAEGADLANKQLQKTNEWWLGILQKKLETGDVDGFNKEFDKYDKYMTSSIAGMAETNYKSWGKQNAQQNFLNSTKSKGLIAQSRDLGTGLLGMALDVMDLPRRGVNTAWNLIDKDRTRTYYDGSVKKGGINNVWDAFNESYNQNVVSRHQLRKYDDTEARKKWSVDYKQYKAGKALPNVNPNPYWQIPSGLSEADYFKKRWQLNEEQTRGMTDVQDFFADPTFVNGFARKPLRNVAQKISATSLWKSTHKTLTKMKNFAKTGLQSVTSRPKVASAIIGARYSKLGQAVDWLKKPSTSTAKGRWEHNPAAQKARQGLELAQAEFDELVSNKWQKTFNKQLQLLPTKIKDASGKLVRVEGVDVLKTRLTKMNKTQSRAFNHYVQAAYDGKKLVSPAYSWAGKDKYWSKLSRKDRAVVANLSTAYKAVTDKLYSIDRLTAKRGLSKVDPNIRTFTGGFYEGAPPQSKRGLASYQKKQGYIAKQFKYKSWSERLEKMKQAMRPKTVNKWDMIARKDPTFTRHKVVSFSQQSGKELAESLDKRIIGSRKAFGETLPETYLVKTQGKRLKGYVQNPNQRWIGNGTLDNKFNPDIKMRSGIEGYKADLADMAASREFKKGGWEKVMEVAGLPKRVWSQSVTRFRPAWYLNNIAYNIPASYGAAGSKATGAYKQILKEAVTERSLTPKILRELPKEVTNMSARYGTLGTKIENISRGAAYVAMRDAGMPKAEALKRMNDWLFDYAKTANWERPLRTVMPFWSFHKGLAMIAVKAPLKYPKASFLIASFKREFMEKPLAQIPDEEVTWTDPITGQVVQINKRDLYRGKIKVPFTDNKWVNSPFFPFGDSKISLHPILDLFEEHKSGLDNFGRDVTDKEFWRKAVARIPQLEIVARAYEATDQKMDPEKYIQRWVSENGTTKWAQGFDPAATNYKKELDNSKRFWDNARSFFGMSNVYDYDYEDQDYKSRMAEFQREYFAENWSKMDWDARDKAQKALAKKHGLTLDEVYKNWARYDTPASTAIKAQKEDARNISKKFWEDYFKKDKGQQYIKDVQEGKKSERAAFLREYLVKQMASGGFGDNRFLIGEGTIKKTLMSLAQDIAYSEVKTQRFLSVNAAKVRKAKGDYSYVWRGKVISTPPSAKALAVRKALETGDWSAYRTTYGVKDTQKAQVVKQAIASGDWSEYRRLYGETKRSPEAKFWEQYMASSKDERMDLMKKNPQYDKRKNWTQAQWDEQRIKDRIALRKKISLVAGDKVEAYKKAAIPKTARALAWRHKNKAVLVKWKR